MARRTNGTKNKNSRGKRAGAGSAENNGVARTNRSRGRKRSLLSKLKFW